MSTVHSGEQEISEILTSSLVNVRHESNEGISPSHTLRRAALPVASTYRSTLLLQLRAAPGRVVAMTDVAIDGPSAALEVKAHG